LAVVLPELLELLLELEPELVAPELPPLVPLLPPLLLPELTPLLEVELPLDEVLLELEPLLEVELLVELAPELTPLLRVELLLGEPKFEPPPPQPANASAAKASAQVSLVRIERSLSAARDGAIDGDEDVAAEEEWQAEIEIVGQHVGAGAGRRSATDIIERKVAAGQRVQIGDLELHHAARPIRALVGRRQRDRR
jgi:hypothetical protein